MYTRIYNGVVNTTAEEPYTGNTEDDYWIEHDNSVEYYVGQVYVKPVVVMPTNWQVSTMDDQPINYYTDTNRNLMPNQTAIITGTQ
jgi:hypothetical protein